jgi:undecaprenyl-diphosphatase
MDYFASLLDWVGAHAIWAGPVIFLVALLESLALVGLVVPGAFLMFGFGALIGSGRLEF